MLSRARRLGLLVACAAMTLAPAGAAQEGRLGDRAELTRFVDRLVAAQMNEHEIPGAVVVVVEDGEVVLSKGYGHTDLARTEAVDPERTRFDIGSVTKLLTATAVMQQVERGRLDLDADVNRYLSAFQVPETFPEPVTTAHLLTHTAGFADRHLVRMVAGSPDGVEPLADNLAANLPPRIRPPGQTHQYSNHGMALAGHLVEAVSGQPFDAYLHEHVLEPLGMEHTTFGTPAGPPSEDAVGHESLLGPTTAVNPWYLVLRPAGGLWSTGADMSRFMLAHLNGGELAGTRILGAASVEQMQRTQFSPHPQLSAIGYGFFERRSDGRRVVQHGGGWIGFGSLLALLPDAGAGVFVSFNHGQGVSAAVALVDALLERYFPVTAPAADAASPGGPAGSYEGTYRWNRVDRDTFMRLVSTLQTATLDVRASDDGRLTTSMSPQRLLTETSWVETQPGVFRSVDGGNTLVFETDDDGRAIGLHVTGAQLFSMDRLAWYQTTGFHAATLLFFLAALLVAAAGWPAGRLYRRLRGRRLKAPADLRRARRLAGLAGILGLAFFVGFALFFAADSVRVLQVSTAFKALLWLPLASAVVTGALVAVVARLWSRREAGLAARLYHSGIALALVALVPFLYYWRLLGFHY